MPLPNDIAAERQLLAMLTADPGLVPVVLPVPCWPDDMYVAAHVTALASLGRDHHARTPSSDASAVAKVTELAQRVRDASILREAVLREQVRAHQLGEVA